MFGRRALVVLLPVAAIVTSCTGSADPTTTTGDEFVSTTTVPELPATTTTMTQPQQRWFEVNGDQFVDTRTGDEFVPRGVNLLLKTGGGGPDRMFANYNPEWVEDQLAGIERFGFNTVRFFLDMCMECTSNDEGIRSDYLDKLADLLTRLEAHGLAAFPTSNDVPDPGYSNRLPCCEPFGGYRNSLYLSSEGHEIAVEYWTDLITGILERGAPTHHLLGWELANEQFVLRDVAPISLTSGEVTTADGHTYELSDDEAVSEMVVSNLRSYLTTVGEAIRAVDEGALISMGFFSAEDPTAGRVAADNRWVVPDHILDDSSLDFVDLHAYPGLGGTWDAIGPAYGLDGSSPGFPLLLGEFGAFEVAYPDPDEAAAAMARFESESCDWAFGGSLIWFWGADQDDEVVTADAHDGAVAEAVSPLTRPDRCEVGSYQSANLALSRPVTASAEENEEYSAGRVTDGSDATWWSAAEGPPQWVEIDLGEITSISKVGILIGHVSPPGPQTHRVYVRDTPASDLRLVGEAAGDISQGEWIEVEFESLMAQAVRVETVSVDGWVIIHEITVGE